MATWNDTVLATDSDLQAYEAKMPELAKRFVGESGANAYDAKRDLAKRDVAQRLTRMSIDLDTLTEDNVLALNQVAVYRELYYIFSDMAGRSETVLMEKARRYAEQYEDAWIDVQLALEVIDTVEAPTNIPLGRA